MAAGKSGATGGGKVGTGKGISSATDDRIDGGKCHRVAQKISFLARSAPGSWFSREIYGERQLAAELMRRRQRGSAEDRRAALHIGPRGDAHALAVAVCGGRGEREEMKRGIHRRKQVGGIWFFGTVVRAIEWKKDGRREKSGRSELHPCPARGRCSTSPGPVFHGGCPGWRRSPRLQPPS